MHAGVYDNLDRYTGLLMQQAIMIVQYVAHRLCFKRRATWDHLLVCGMTHAEFRYMKYLRLIEPIYRKTLYI